MIQLSEITNSISPSLTRRLFNLAQKYDNVIDFTLGDPDIHPHDKIKEAGCKAILEGRTRYSPNAGLLELREIISSRYKLQYNIEYNPTNEIMVTVGGMEGLYLTLLAILNRGDEIHIWPLSFAEFMSVYEGSKEEGWAEYLMFGGLPQLLTQVGDDKKADFLRRLYRTVYLRDIYERNPIEMKAEFEELSKIVASSIGAPVNAQNIANTFKSVSKAQGLSVKTISTYLGYMQDSFLIEKSERYDIKGRKYIGALCKYYYQDIGLRNAILSFRQNETTHIMENVIYNEMRMRGWLVDVGNIFHRVRNEAGKQQRVTLEVDFVCNKGSERIYIQSAYKMPDVEKMEQEKRSLKLVDDSFRKIIVVGEHTKTWSDEKGIQIVSIYDFLLTPSFTE